MVESSIATLVRRRMRETNLAILEDGLKLAGEHNAWMEKTPDKEVARIFNQFGEPTPGWVAMTGLERRIAELKADLE